MGPIANLTDKASGLVLSDWEGVTISIMLVFLKLDQFWSSWSYIFKRIPGRVLILQRMHDKQLKEQSQVV